MLFVVEIIIEETLSEELVFSKKLQSPEVIQEISHAYNSSFPYEHYILNGWICDNLLKKVRQEILENLVFSEKETDIYKVFQTGDLANLSGLEKNEYERLLSLSCLKNALYSDTFRQFLSKVTGCSRLSGSMIDISINMYNQGCHLLVHDDVIGTREVSFILYLVDPDQPWLPSDGGALRLYSTLHPSFPNAWHEKVILPSWNQLCFFRVQAGRSFHDVEEVYSKNKLRLSISGWFHRLQPEEWQTLQDDNNERILSTLQSLHSNVLGLDEPQIKPKICVFNVNEFSDKLSKNDIDYLKSWINSEYLEDMKMIQMKEAFLKNSTVDLLNFLESSLADRVKQWILDMESHKCPLIPQDIKLPWKLSQPIHKHRYLYIDSDTTAYDIPYALLLDNLLNHSAFHRWLCIWTTLTPHSVFSIGRRFRPGIDYTLATPYTSEQPMLNLTLCLTPLGHWENGENGGYEVYMEEDKDADSAVYRVSDDPVLISHLPTWNTLHVVLRDQGVLRFVKYISKEAQASRWDIITDISLSDTLFSSSN